MTVEIEVPEPRVVALDSTKTAIVVIDMENEFCAPGGKKLLDRRRKKPYVQRQP